ncbi:PLP-dependent aminotransferase family protein [Nostocaceae cyanobacterium CENA357]|uniref:PLP-dependent aminotransferase family protein n=1 Tax=Atlanticothrix silvestris CENA357 TaxID=1725252 RepID=A0A8J7KWD4_9CYAN|nr:PLP-dependent aminotransferase family protein [Atlanticothrix silvestris]MBH8551495.1 PLP-dependent aminotransferase family protein [Atlanticothrix silvestris CENA357]
MNIPLNRHSPTPIYLQIRNYLSRLIQSGKMLSGQKLPSIRVLSTSIQVNKLTVIEAYSLLEADGLIHARQGSGYFVNPKTTVTSGLTLRSNFSPSQEVIISQGGGSFFEQYTTSIQARRQQNIIEFSSGFPSTSISDNLQRVAKRALAKAGDTLFREDFPQGQLLLRQLIAQMLIQQGLEVSSEEIIITSGSQQALSLAMQYYLRKDDWVIVETPTYHGALGILKNLQAKVIGIPMTAEGINLELLEQYLKSHRPKLIYTISTLHNPTGITTSLAHRQALITLARQYECFILEDNAYEGLKFQPVPPPIKALDRYDLVTYISTFSKTLMPGLRIGYMVVTGEHHQPLVKQKLLNDLHVSTVSQVIVSEFLASGHYRRHLNRLRISNLQSRNVMLQALESYFPDAIAWTIPKGGLFLWTHLPNHLPIQTICSEALSHNVLIASGAAFFLGQGYPAMRLNFCHTPEDIEHGIKIIGRLIKNYLTPSFISVGLSSQEVSVSSMR